MGQMPGADGFVEAVPIGWLTRVHCAFSPVKVISGKGYTGKSGDWALHPSGLPSGHRFQLGQNVIKPRAQIRQHVVGVVGSYPYRV